MQNIHVFKAHVPAQFTERLPGDFDLRGNATVELTLVGAWLQVAAVFAFLFRIRNADERCEDRQCDEQSAHAVPTHAF